MCFELQSFTRGAIVRWLALPRGTAAPLIQHPDRTDVTHIL